MYVSIHHNIIVTCQALTNEIAENTKSNYGYTYNVCILLSTSWSSSSYAIALLQLMIRLQILMTQTRITAGTVPIMAIPTPITMIPTPIIVILTLIPTPLAANLTPIIVIPTPITVIPTLNVVIPIPITMIPTLIIAITTPITAILTLFIMIPTPITMMISDSESAHDSSDLDHDFAIPDENMEIDENMFEPLYDGASITVCGAYCAIMEFKRVCRLPFTAIVMLLQLLQLLCPPANKLPRSVYVQKRFFRKYSSSHTTQRFCPECRTELEVNQHKCTNFGCQGKETDYLITLKPDRSIQTIVASTQVTGVATLVHLVYIRKFPC